MFGANYFGHPYLAAGALVVLAGQGAGSAAGTSSALGVGAALVAAVGSAAGTGAAAAVGAADKAAVGTAAGTCTVAGAGQSLAAGTGSATGTSTAEASSIQDRGAGAAAGTSTALAVGRSAAEATGAAAGTATALGVGAANVVAVGSAAGTSTAAATGTGIFEGIGSAAGTSTAAAVGVTQTFNYPGHVGVVVNGVDRTADLRLENVPVSHASQLVPSNTLSGRFGKGYTPQGGEEVKFYNATLSNLFFAGNILSTSIISEGSRENPATDFTVQDYTWQLNKRFVNKRYAEQAANLIIVDIVTNFAPGFTTTNVVAGLPTVTGGIEFTNERAHDAIKRVVNRIGGYAYVDFTKDVHAFLTESSAAPDAIDDANVAFRNVVPSRNLTQLRNKVLWAGGGAPASLEVAVGSTTIPVDDGVWYNAAGGMVKVGFQYITYASRVLGGTGSVVAGKALLPGAPSAAVVAGTPGNMLAGAYSYKVSFVGAQGQSEVGAASGSATITSVSVPIAPTASEVSGSTGNLAVGSYTYKVAFGTLSGETLPSSASSSASISSISAPGAPSGSMASNVGGGILAASFTYKISFITSSGEIPGSLASGTITVTAVSTPGAATLADATGGNVPATAHAYYVTYVDDIGETTTGSQATITVTNNAVDLTNIPTSSDGRVKRRRIYRTDGSESSATSRMVGELNDNTTTTFKDTLGTNERGGNPLSTNTSGSGKIDLTSIPTSGNGRVTGRKVYRSNNGTDYYLVGTISNNTATTFTDNMSQISAAAQPTIPGSDTGSTGRMSVTISTSTDGRVTKRFIYRTAVGSADGHKLIGTVNNNTDTSFADNVPDTSRGAPEPATNTSGSGQVSVTSVPLGPAGTTARNIWRTEAGGSAYRFVRRISNNVDTSFTDNTADAQLGESVHATSAWGASAGDTSLRVADLAQFQAGGWARAGEQLVKFTGRSAASGEGDLTGVPASGVGSIGAPIKADSTVVNHPHLAGIAASGTGSVLFLIPQGAQVDLVAVAEDAASQATYGVIEHFDSDNRYNYASALSAAQADLALYKDPIVKVTYETPDIKAVVGKTVHFALTKPSIAGDYKIQSVNVAEEAVIQGGKTWRQVTASNVLFTFEDMFRRMQIMRE